MKRSVTWLAWLPAVLLAAFLVFSSLHQQQLTPLKPVPVQLTAGESVEIVFSAAPDAAASAQSSAPEVASFAVSSQQDGRIVCRLTAQSPGQATITCAAGRKSSPAYALSVVAPPQQQTVSQPDSGAFVASVTGEKYHLADCASARQIKEQNCIYFQSAQQAEAEGYTPCARCLG